MPSLGSDMEAGTLTEWLVKPGDAVRRGDIVAVVETEKGAIEIEIFDSGVVSELVVPVGDKVPVGSLLARIEGKPGERPAAPMPAPAPLSTPAPAPAPVVAATPPRTAPAPRQPPAIAEGRVKTSPAARKLAKERGVALEHLKGTGVEGAISLADVEAVIGKPVEAAVPAARGGGFDPAAMRKAIAAAMARSKREIPHYYLTTTVNLGPALSWLKAANRDRPPAERLLPAVLFLKAVAVAIEKAPELNGFWENGAFRAGEGVHIGWAIALRGGGLIAPAILDANERPLDDLMQAMRDLVRRARQGGLRSSELSHPTITITSLGERGAESVLPVIYPPQVASVGFGRIVTRPWAVDDSLTVRPIVNISLAGDHRASDGHRGGLLLVEIDKRLQEPEAL
jgi:pyruvate dehydrogenase E2 component (dihydrolipoamide acetyltransferase)